MSDESLVITEAGFLTEFLNQHTQRADRPFCFIIGAGASLPSGIPAGGNMARVWLNEIHEAENFDGLPLEEGATAERLEIPGFSLDELARHYPQLYRRRYGGHEQAGYAFLESQMEAKEPSYGYSVLAYLLSETTHRVVITTNFDNLVADALSIHSSRFPLVIGHDTLAQFAAVELRRPLVAKIHGALGFAPKSQPDDISALPEGWKTALGRIMERYTPIVIGYEGNDGSLMSFLKSLPDHVPDRILWCVYAPDATPAQCVAHVSADVRAFVRSRRGRFVPIQGFDELMAKILIKLGTNGIVPDLYERMKERARERERSYDEQQRRLFEAAIPKERATRPATPASTRGTKRDRTATVAVSQIADSRRTKPWWAWVEEARATRDTEAQDTVYRQALQSLPNDPDLLRNYGRFQELRGNLDEAEKYYQLAIDADPRLAVTLVFYAGFLEKYRNDLDQAEDYYKTATRADPIPTTLVFYANFLNERRKNFDAAEELYRRAIEAGPNDVFALRSFAAFLHKVRGANVAAETFFLRAVDTDPRNRVALLDYAAFLQDMERNPDLVEEFYTRSLEVDPKNPHTLKRYAAFLRDVRKDFARAKEMERRAEEAEAG